MIVHNRRRILVSKASEKEKKDVMGYVGLMINFLAFVMFVGLSFLGGLGFTLGLIVMLIVWIAIWWNVLVPRNIFGTIVPAGSYKVLAILGQPYKPLCNVVGYRVRGRQVVADQNYHRKLGGIYFFLWPVVKVQYVCKIDYLSETGEDEKSVVDSLPGYVVPFSIVVDGIETVGGMQMGFRINLRGIVRDPLTRVQVRRWKSLLTNAFEPVTLDIGKLYDYYDTADNQTAALSLMEEEVRALLPENQGPLGMDLECVGVASANAPKEVDKANADERMAKAESRRAITIANAQAETTKIAASAESEASRLRGEGRAAALRAEIGAVRDGGEAGKAVLVAEAARTSPVGLAVAANLINLSGIGEGKGLTVDVKPNP